MKKGRIIARWYHGRSQPKTMGGEREPIYYEGEGADQAEAMTNLVAQQPEAVKGEILFLEVVSRSRAVQEWTFKEVGSR